MTTLGDLQAWIREWEATVDAYASAKVRMLAQDQEIARLRARVRELEGEAPPPSKLERVPFTEPPLLLNKGSWDDYPDAPLGRHRVLEDGSLEITLGQKAGREERAERVVRHDFGLAQPGGGGFLHEPMDTPRAYEVVLTIQPGAESVEKCNLWQIHTGGRTRPPYLSFMIWNGTTRWRHDTGTGERSDYAKKQLQVSHAYKIRVEAYWSKGIGGYVRVVEDGEKVIDYNGPTVAEDDSPPYMGDQLPQ